MWCRACGAPLSSLAPACVACGRPTGLLRPSAPCDETGPGEPCEAGRRMGGYAVRETGTVEHVTGTTLAGMPTAGEQTLFELSGPGAADLRLAYVEWDCGEREIRRTHRHETPWRQDRLLGRPRIDIVAWAEGFLCMELGRVAVHEEDDAPVLPASEFELDMAARACIRCALQIAGATAMGTRQEVLGVCDDRRHVLCTTFPVGARLVPAVVFLLTRVAPLLHGDQAERV